MNTKKELIPWILELLSKKYIPITVLHFKSPWELMVATILSAQSRDVKVNEITEVLFKKYNTPEHFLSLSIPEMENKIKSINYYKTKAQRILEAAKVITEKFDGKVPDQMKDLLSIPGIARKSANVILSEAFHKNEGIVVDTHVLRLSNRLGLSKEKTAEKIEKDLLKIVPKKDWGVFSHYLIFLGREICQSQKPKCEICLLSSRCPGFKKI